MPRHARSNLLRRRWLAPTAVVLALGTLGCAPGLMFRGDRQELDELVATERPEEEDRVQLVGDLVVAVGLTPQKVEAVALVTGLNQTGSDPSPSPQRTRLKNEMQTHDVKHPDQVLASNATSLVLVRGFIPPGAQEGDRFDVEVRVPTRSETTSLRGGWLMKARLREMEVFGNTIHTGHVSGLAGGPVVTDSTFDASGQPQLATRGRVLGGGVVLRPRTIGLGIRSSYASVLTSSRIGGAINQRFHTLDKRRVATPKSDSYLELAVDPRYKNNLTRYLRVISSIAVRETNAERAQRILQLERMLLEPTTAARAALQLEAIGSDGTSSLLKGLGSPDVEVRFYAAEALAYLDQAEAAPVLTAVARQEPAFRWHALTALSVMDHVAALDALSELLNDRSAETRYGAFRALRARNPNSPLVRGEILQDQLALHVVGAEQEPMVHVARAVRPEVVVFGHEVHLRAPQVLSAGQQVMITAAGPGQVRLSRFAPGEEDRFETSSTRVDEVIRAAVRLGANYTDVAQMLEEAKRRDYLTARLVLDARPPANRRFRRGESLVDGQLPGRRAAHPLPEMFVDALDDEEPEDRLPERIDPPEGDGSTRSWFGRMTDWFRR